MVNEAQKLQAEFESLAKPLIKFLCDKFNPHTSIIITATDAEILQGMAAISTTEFLRD